MRKRILFVVEAMGGGVFTYIVDLANGLADMFDMYIAYAVRSQTPKDYRDYFDKRVHLIKVCNFARSINLWKDIKAFFEIRKIAEDVRPDIIHLHSSKAGILGRWAFNGKKIPLYYTPHGYSFLMQDQGNAKRMFYKALETVSARRRCTTISCSRGEHLETLRMTNDAVYVSNGINIREMRRMLEVDGKSAEGHPFTVFTVGRICPQKAPEMFNRVAEKFPDVKFVWIGDGNLRDILTASNIEVTGWMDRKKALRLAYQGDMFLLTSLWEGLPISLLEAMYMKKPCVVSDAAGNRDVIRDGENGFLCRNEGEFVAAVRKVRTESLEEMTEKAYREVIDIYNTEKMVEQYVRIYNREKEAVPIEIPIAFRGGYPRTADEFTVDIHRYIDGSRSKCVLAAGEAVAA